MRFRSWLSCWMRRSWVGFLCWSSPTSRTCWQPPPPPRSQRVSTCTPSVTAYGRSRRAPPSLERAFRWARGPFFLRLRDLFPHVMALYFASRKGWIGCARASTPRKNSFDCGLSEEEQQLQQHTHAHWHTHCTFLSLRMTGSVNVNTPLIHHGLFSASHFRTNAVVESPPSCIGPTDGESQRDPASVPACVRPVTASNIPVQPLQFPARPHSSLVSLTPLLL